MKKHYREQNDCLNCRTILSGHYCHNCGQENLELKENFGHLMNHAVSDYFHFDHQFFHTLNPLLFKPGKLTNEYMAGRRMQYLHPIKMYIFISLVFFVLLFKKAGDDKEEAISYKNITQKETAKVKKQLDANPALSKSQKAIIMDAVRQNAVKDSLKKKGVASDEDDVNIKKPGEKDRFSMFGMHVGDTDDSTYDAYLQSQKKLPADDRDGFFARLYERKMYSYKKYGSRAKDIFEEEFKHNIPKMMFVLLPLFALILGMSFIRNHKYYVEHLIFSFHLHSFLFLTLTISMVILWILPTDWGLAGWINTIVTLWIIYYIYKSFRVFYQRSRWRTVSKMIGISFAYLMVFSFCMLLLVFITGLTAA